MSRVVLLAMPEDLAGELSRVLLEERHYVSRHNPQGCTLPVRSTAQEDASSQLFPLSPPEHVGPGIYTMLKLRPRWYIPADDLGQPVDVERLFNRILE